MKTKFSSFVQKTGKESEAKREKEPNVCEFGGVFARLLLKRVLDFKEYFVKQQVLERKSEKYLTEKWSKRRNFTGIYEISENVPKITLASQVALARLAKRLMKSCQIWYCKRNWPATSPNIIFAS